MRASGCGEHASSIGEALKLATGILRQADAAGGGGSGEDQFQAVFNRDNLGRRPPLIGPPHRRQLFVEEFIRNGHRTGAAAEAAGYRHNVGGSVLRRPEVKAEIIARAREVAEQEYITTREWAENLAAVAYLDIADLFDAEGALIPAHKLPSRVTKAVASISVVERVLTDGTVERTTQIKFCDKNAALSTMARHLGLFERDNRQRTPDLQLVVNLV